MVYSQLPSASREFIGLAKPDSTYPCVIIYSPLYTQADVSSLEVAERINQKIIRPIYWYVVYANFIQEGSLPTNLNDSMRIRYINDKRDEFPAVSKLENPEKYQIIMLDNNGIVTYISYKYVSDYIIERVINNALHNNQLIEY